MRCGVRAAGMVLRRIACLGPAVALGLAAAAGAEPRRVEGITEPIHDAQLSSLVAGRIEKIVLKEGSEARQGDVIVALDQRLEELEVARRKLVWENRSELDGAEHRVTTLLKDLEATRNLYDSTRSVSREELDKRILEHKMAVAERDRLAAVEEREKIEYEMAVEQLQRRRIAAPFDGVVTEIHLDAGEDCEPQRPVARLVDRSRCYLVLNIEAALAAGLDVGREAAIEVDAGGRLKPLRGEIAFVAPVVDPASGLRKVKILFDNADGSVAPGVSGFMAFAAGTAAAAP